MERTIEQVHSKIRSLVHGLGVALTGSVETFDERLADCFRRSEDKYCTSEAVAFLLAIGLSKAAERLEDKIDAGYEPSADGTSKLGRINSLRDKLKNTKKFMSDEINKHLKYAAELEEELEVARKMTDAEISAWVNNAKDFASTIRDQIRLAYDSITIHDVVFKALIAMPGTAASANAVGLQLARENKSLANKLRIAHEAASRAANELAELRSYKQEHESQKEAEQAEQIVADKIGRSEQAKADNAAAYSKRAAELEQAIRLRDHWHENYKAEKQAHAETLKIIDQYKVTIPAPSRKAGIVLTDFDRSKSLVLTKRCGECGILYAGSCLYSSGEWILGTNIAEWIKDAIERGDSVALESGSVTWGDRCRHVENAQNKRIS